MQGIVTVCLLWLTSLTYVSCLRRLKAEDKELSVTRAPLKPLRRSLLLRFKDPDSQAYPLDAPNGKSVSIHPFVEGDQYISESIRQEHKWDKGIVQKLCDMFSDTSKGHFLDVGANIGTYTLPMASCLEDRGKVISFEAMPVTQEHLANGIISNGFDNVDLYPIALGEQPGTLKMQLDPTNKGQSMVVGNDQDDAPAQERKQKGFVPTEMDLEVTSIDTVAQSNHDLKNVLVAKVDIEGSEGKFLQGAEQLLADNPPCYLMMELNPFFLKNAGTPVPFIEDLLRKAGYERKEQMQEPNRTDDALFVQEDLEGCKARFS
jgi:FkbM family methyltransferase